MSADDTADTEENGYPLTEAMLERDRWRRVAYRLAKWRDLTLLRAEKAEAEIARLRAENARFREALEWIREHDLEETYVEIRVGEYRKIKEPGRMADCARAALEGGK
jgi:hypothetical protein